MQAPTETLDAARGGDEEAFRALIDPHRRGLLAHCYRMAGSLQDAEDMVQEALLRAWRGLSGFEGRSSFQSWIYRIATHATLDALRSAKSRSLPVAVVAAARPSDMPEPPALDMHWLEPFPDALLPTGAPSADAVLSQRESISLAFMQALQTLPASQRAAVLLKDVVGLSASEVAEMLETSAPAVNSLVQRARATLSSAAPPREVVEKEERAVLDRFVTAWMSADVDRLVTLLREDARLSMPPSHSWYEGREAIAAFLRAVVLPPDSVGRYALIPTRANDMPAMVMVDQGQAIGVQLYDVRSGLIFEAINFMDPLVVSRFSSPQEFSSSQGAPVSAPIG